MRHVKLARDRRRRKLQIKIAIFFSIILFIVLVVSLGKKEEGQDSSADSQTQTETQIEKQPALSTATVESPSSVQADSTLSPPSSAESVEKQAITEHHTESSAVSMDEKTVTLK